MTATGRGSEFEGAVVRVLRSLRPGDVVTYGEVAVEAGYPKLSRAVGSLLASGDLRVPWWRVVTAAAGSSPGTRSSRRHACATRASRSTRRLGGSGGAASIAA